MPFVTRIEETSAKFMQRKMQIPEPKPVAMFSALPKDCEELTKAAGKPAR